MNMSMSRVSILSVLTLILGVGIMTFVTSSSLLAMFTQAVVYAISALGVGFLLRQNGLVSFGHALYLGLGAYVVGIAAHHGSDNGWLQLLITVGLSAAIGALTGLVSLRTVGVAFIMITLAFAQMIYYLVNSIKAYGGDEGLNIKQRSDFGLGLDLKNDVTFYFVVLLVLAVTLVLISRIMHSRFGRVILAIGGSASVRASGLAHRLGERSIAEENLSFAGAGPARAAAGSGGSGPGPWAVLARARSLPRAVGLPLTRRWAPAVRLPPGRTAWRTAKFGQRASRLDRARRGSRPAAMQVPRLGWRGSHTMQPRLFPGPSTWPPLRQATRVAQATPAGRVSRSCDGASIGVAWARIVVSEAARLPARATRSRSPHANAARQQIPRVAADHHIK